MALTRSPRDTSIVAKSKLVAELDLHHLRVVLVPYKVFEEAVQCLFETIRDGVTDQCQILSIEEMYSVLLRHMQQSHFCTESDGVVEDLH